jgi:pilus assembly protein CpaC
LVKKNFERKSKSYPVVISFLLSLILVSPSLFDSTSQAADALIPQMEETEAIEIIAGKTIVVRSKKPIKRVFVAEPKIAKADVFSPREIVLTGKSPGTTTMSLWQEDKGMVGIYTLEISYDIARLKQKLHSLFPHEKDLRVIATQDSISLSGKISDSSSLSEALSVAKAFAPEGKVNNLVEVGGLHQVMLEVRVAEMNKSLTRDLGVNLNYVNNNDFGVSTLGRLTKIVEPDDANIDSKGPFGLFVTEAINALFRFNKGSASWTGFIDALKEEGLVKVLAEPTLIALSGQTASFLAGGEFPVPIPQGLGTVAIEYKNFGVGLSFSPKVLNSDKINIKVTPEVSELDFTNAVRFEGFVVPGLTTRRASTVVELADGQSFAIAGLLKENVRDTLSKYPLLGDIPVLGQLFRSRNFQKGETELIIIVTPHLVKPLNAVEQTLPTDYYAEPSDGEFYLLGLMQGRNKRSSSYQGELDGDFGHSLPDSY